MSDIAVSVLCLAYNHENYIRRCLDGLVMQQTDFAFEVIIHDDASTDNTAAIIREYQERYPDIIKPIFQTENQHSKKIAITRTYLSPASKGRYIAFCEGDDYWTDPHKLQKQFDALSAHPECHMCVHSVEIVTEDEQSAGRTYPENLLPTGVLSSRKFLELACQTATFHTTSFFIDGNLYRSFSAEPPAFRTVAKVGDDPTLLFFGSQGAVYYLSDTMSCYREKSKGSWSSHVENDMSFRIAHYERMIREMQEFDTFTHGEYHDICVRRITHFSFLIDYHQKNYKAFFKPKYREILRAYPVKFRAKQFLRAFFPWILRDKPTRKESL